MIVKNKEHNQAIILRKSGLTYSEILDQIKVSKSTLSLWLQNVGLGVKQKQRITEKRNQGRLKALDVITKKRKKVVHELLSKGLEDIGKVSQRDLLVIGTALYWAEGAKQHENNVSQVVDFTNSDSNLLKVFILWLDKCCKVHQKDLIYELYIHVSVGTNETEDAVNWWKNKLLISQANVIKIRFKKHKLLTNRRIHDYHGQFRVKVRRSTNLNRKIDGWIKGIYCGVV